MDDTLMFEIMFLGLWALIGTVFFIAGIAMLNDRKEKEKNCTMKTYGKVTDISKHQTRSNGSYTTSWHPVFEYSIGDLTFIKESIYGSSQIKYAIGQSVEVYYNPENYNEYYVEGYTLPKTLATIFTVVGICVMSIVIISAILVF